VKVCLHDTTYVQYNIDRAYKVAQNKPQTKIRQTKRRRPYSQIAQFLPEILKTLRAVFCGF